MSRYFKIFLLLLFAACNRKDLKLTKSGEVGFRITYNYFRELTGKELDSLQKSKPTYMDTGEQNKFYDLLEKKKFVVNKCLDTSGLDLKDLSIENPKAHIQKKKFNLELDTAIGHQYLYINKDQERLKMDLGQIFPGDRLFSLYDIDDDGKPELIILEKYYIIGGDNFDLKCYHLD